MCREYEHERIDLNQVGAQIFGELELSEAVEDEVFDDRTAVLSISDLNSPIQQVNPHRGSPSPVVEGKLVFLRLPRLIVTLLIGFAVFSIECYLFDFPEFQSEINRHTQLLGGLTTAVGGVALLTQTNRK